MSDTEKFKIGNYVFTLGVNTVRQDRGRTSLIAARERYIYGDKFPSELERRAAIESLDPFYSDIVGSCRAVDDDTQHELLRGFVYEPAKWDDFFWDNYEHKAEFIAATLWAQQQHAWYPKPQVTPEEAPEAAAVIKDTLAAIDLDNPDDVDQPDPAAIRAAVQERADIAAEKRSDDFLESEK
jgi:hypothetical protein